MGGALGSGIGWEASMTPQISVIIPTHDRRALVEAAILSVLDQGLADIEIIVVDDGSTDGTSDYLRARGLPITLITQANAGVAAARNAGLRAARGAYVTFLDSDDLSAPGGLAAFKKALPLDRPTDVLVGRCATFSPTDPAQLSRSNMYNFAPIATGEIVDASVLFSGFTSACLCLYSKAAAERVGGFPSLTMGEDYVFNARLALAGARFVAIDAVVVHVRLHAAPRLSTARGAAAVDGYARLLPLAAELLDACPAVLEGDALCRCRLAAGRWLFGIARSCYRLRARDLGDRYLALAQAQAGRGARAGSPLARAVFSVLPPRYYEDLTAPLRWMLGLR